MCIWQDTRFGQFQPWQAEVEGDMMNFRYCGVVPELTAVAPQ
jgi:hypothetical protein